METPSPKLLPLLTRAAELRAGASSWVTVAEHVRRSPETCRQGPRLYPELWRRLYREATGQRTAEAQLYLRKRVRHDDPKISLRAAQLLQRGWEEPMDREDRLERPDPARVAAEVAEFAKYLKGMTDDQLARHLADFLARRPSGGKGKSTLSPFSLFFGVFRRTGGLCRGGVGADGHAHQCQYNADANAVHVALHGFERSAMRASLQLPRVFVSTIISSDQDSASPCVALTCFACEIICCASVQHTAADVPAADWRKCASYRGGADRRAQRTSLGTHVDGTDARRAEQATFISQVVDLQGFWIRTRNAWSRVSSVKCRHLRNPGRLAWHDWTPVGCGVQQKRLVMVRERRRLAKAARPQP
jgi:hypothetical protein